MQTAGGVKRIMLKRFTVSFDVFDLHGTLIERGYRDIFANSAMEAKNKVSHDYSAKQTWGHIKVKNFKIVKFVPVAPPTKPTAPKFLVEYVWEYQDKRSSGEFRRGLSEYQVTKSRPEKIIVTAKNKTKALDKVLASLLKINRTSRMSSVRVSEVDAGK